MPKIVNKFASLIVILIIAYLTHFSVRKPALVVAVGSEKLPIITKEMFHPEFIEPQESTSSIDRNPFKADWNNYSDEESPVSVIVASDSSNTAFSGELMGIISGNDGQRLALISGEVYSVGSSISSPSSGQLWQISSISDESVVLICNELQAVLKIANVFSDFSDFNDFNDVSMGIFMDEGQKESVR